MERMNVSLPDGTKERAKAIAEPRGLSVATYLRMAILAALKREEGE